MRARRKPADAFYKRLRSTYVVRIDAATMSSRILPDERVARMHRGVCLCWLASNAHADVFRPAYLELREAGSPQLAISATT